MRTDEHSPENNKHVRAAFFVGDLNTSSLQFQYYKVFPVPLPCRPLQRAKGTKDDTRTPVEQANARQKR
jgi:hypothetical protein